MVSVVSDQLHQWTSSSQLPSAQQTGHSFTACSDSWQQRRLPLPAWSCRWGAQTSMPVLGTTGCAADLPP